MAALSAILNALRRAVKRDLGTFGSLKLNNFFLFIALMIWGALQSGVEPKSAEPLLLLLFLVMMFPLSSDPLQKIPSVRLAMWPLAAGRALGVAAGQPGIEPGAVDGHRHPAAEAGQAGARHGVPLCGGGCARRDASGTAGGCARIRLERAPLHAGFPGRLGGLVRKNLREMLSVLDVYIAALLSIGGVGYRLLAAHPDPAAFPILSLVVALTISTYAQCLFGLDLRSSAMMRYRMLPLAGWEILLAKDLAFLGILLLLVLPLAPAPGMTFGLAALAIGHYPSLRIPAVQQRWRFTGSRLFPGVVQALVALALGFGEFQRGWIFFAISTAFYGLSLWVGGRYWDRQA